MAIDNLTCPWYFSSHIVTYGDSGGSSRTRLTRAFTPRHSGNLSIWGHEKIVPSCEPHCFLRIRDHAETNNQRDDQFGAGLHTTDVTDQSELLG
jgi:hypothetical protein